ncbi:MAG TPA: hypothetical protein VFK57_16550 [Vicinamibacterales bacterium]|nr:hypothetical protein [Vicinamibacterales bacterium]
MTPSATEPERQPCQASGAGRATVEGQVRTIARATFDGFLQSDLMPTGMQAPAIIWATAFLVAPSLLFPVAQLYKYSFLRTYFPELIERTMWSDRMIFLVMSAGAVGLVSVVLWDTLFPARRDAFVLTPMPVSLPVQMIGRLAGLMALCVVFVIGLNALPSLIFPVVALGQASAMPRAMLAHFIATAAADVFVFFSVTSLQGIVILGLGRRTAARLASLAQVSSVLILLVSLLFIGGIRGVTVDAFLRGDAADPVLRFSPSAWFLGLYEYLAGTARGVMPALALRGAAAAIVPLAVTIGIYAFGYKRLLARAMETPPRSTRFIGVTLASWLLRRVIRRPAEQAVAAFVLRAISRSGRHSMLMSIYVGAGLAMMVTFVLPEILRSGASAFAEPSVFALALPLVLSAALAVGFRILITIPAEMPARWVFQTTAIEPRRVDAAVHKTMLLVVAVPTALTAAMTAGALWGPRVAAQHAAYCFALAAVLCELMLLRYRGIPLTRPYVPGASQFHLLWALYLTAFTTYTMTSANLERELMRSGGTSGIAWAVAIFGAIALALWARRKWKVRAWTDVPFEAEMPDDQMFQGFNLSEIHAAQAVASRANGEGTRPV